MKSYTLGCAAGAASIARSTTFEVATMRVLGNVHPDKYTYQQGKQHTQAGTQPLLLAFCKQLQSRNKAHLQGQHILTAVIAHFEDASLHPLNARLLTAWRWLGSHLKGHKDGHLGC